MPTTTTTTKMPKTTKTKRTKTTKTKLPTTSTTPRPRTPRNNETANYDATEPLRIRTIGVPLPYSLFYMT